jgi:hypothetical protein
MIAHVGGMPFEELLVPLILGASAFAAGARALISRHSQSRLPRGESSASAWESTRERSPS